MRTIEATRVVNRSKEVLDLVGAGLRKGGEVRINGQRLVARNTGCGWRSMIPMDEDNETNDIEFTSVFVFGTPELAAEFEFRLMNRCRGLWDVYFYYARTDRSRYFWLSQAALQCTRMMHGVSVTVGWQVVGGKILEPGETPA